MSAEAIRQAATESAYLAQRLATNLLAATTAGASPESRVASMTEGFAAWALLCRRMALLEDYAPRTSDAGRDRDDAMLERMAAFRDRIIAQA
jgi:hypothetical protein